MFLLDILRTKFVVQPQSISMRLYLINVLSSFNTKNFWKRFLELLEETIFQNIEAAPRQDTIFD